MRELNIERASVHAGYDSLSKNVSAYDNVSTLGNGSALANVSIKPPYDYELVSISNISYSSPVIEGN